MSLQNILELASLGVFSIWGIWTELRMRAVTAKNEALSYEVQTFKNKEAVRAESDANALAEFNANISAGK